MPDARQNFAPNLALPWVLRLRYGMALGGAAIVALAAVRFGFDRALALTLAPLAAVLASNVLLARLRDLADRFPQAAVGALFVLDTLCLTAMLGLTGGPMNPFSLLYLVQITLSAVVLERAWTWALGALATVCFGVLFFWNIPFAAFATHHDESPSPHLVGMWIAFVVAACLIAFFTAKISEALRSREREVLLLQDRIAKNERLASLATLAAGAAHELGTPLATIAVVSRELELYAASLEDGRAVQEDAKLIRSEIERCRLILQQMSADGGEPMGEAPRRVSASGLARDAIAQFPEAQRARVFLDAASADDAVSAPAQAVVRSIAALVQNALDASPHDGSVTVRVRRAADSIRFEVVDQGQGMTAEELRRVSEPFFTTKAPGKGMGLGAFLARTLAERLGGGLAYRSAVGKGSSATLSLPAAYSTGDAHVAQ